MTLVARFGPNGQFSVNPARTAATREKSRLNLCPGCLGALDRHTIRERRACREAATDRSEQAATEGQPLE